MADVVTALMTNLPITAAACLAIAATVDLVVVVAVVDLDVYKRQGIKRTLFINACCSIACVDS